VRTRLFLVRHAQTPHNVERRFTGWTDSPLSLAGWQQADDLASFIAHGEPVDVLLSSSLLRAAQTAQVIGDRLGLEPVRRDDLREWFLGECDGLTREEIVERYPGLLERGNELRDLAFRWPGGESRGDFYERVRRAFADIVASHVGKTVAVVSHSAVLSSYLAQAIDGQFWAWTKYQLANCSLTEVTLEDGIADLTRRNVCDFLRTVS
jgi:broad specificity phosphatase PhoE